MGQFYYAAKAFDVLERLDPNPEYWEGKRGACVGIFQHIIAGHEPRLDSSHLRTHAPGGLPQISDWCRPRRDLKYHTLSPAHTYIVWEYPLPRLVCLFVQKKRCFNKTLPNLSRLLRTDYHNQNVDIPCVLSTFTIPHPPLPRFFGSLL